MKRIKIILAIVLTAVLVGLVTSIERTARPITERQPGAAASAEAPSEAGHNH